MAQQLAISKTEKMPKIEGDRHDRYLERAAKTKPTRQRGVKERQKAMLHHRDTGCLDTERSEALGG
jgi:hypothetical protein